MTLSKEGYLTNSKGVCEFHRPITHIELIDVACQVLHSQVNDSDQFFENSREVKKYFKICIGHLEREVFACAFLTTQHQLIEFEVLFMGTVNMAPVYPREVAKRALSLNAAAVVLGHNHPSGCVRPSESDKMITKEIKEALKLFDVVVLDHIITGPSVDAFSFADAGLII